MAGIGDAWGTRDELLHPRDKHGRFRSKWKMAEGVVDKITGFLSGFRPRTFQSDQQAAQYNQNLGGKKRFSLSELARLHADFAPAQEDLRDGDVDDPSTKKFTQMMDSHAIELPDDVIVSRVVGPDAFGLTPQTMTAEEGGLEDFTGKKIADRGYSPVNLGTPLGGGSGQITMSIAVPKGTKATIPGQGGNDRSMYLQRSQSYRVTKVKPDGRGGYYILAVAENDGIEAPEPIGGHVGAGKPTNREGAVRDLQRSQAERMKAEPDQPSTAPTPVGDGGQPQADNAPQAQPALPDGTQPRTEPVAAESIGGGPAPGAPASETPTAPQATVPETPAGPPLEDADVAKLRLRRDAKARYQEMARAAPVAQAMASLSELDSKKVDDKAKAAEIRRILASPVMDEVPKESVGIRADLEQVAKDFEVGKPNLAKARMTRLAKTQGLTSGDKAGSVVDFDEATMDPVGDIPEDGKVEILRPAITKESVLSRGEHVVMERAQVTGAITPSARKAAKKAAPAKKATASASDDDIIARAQKLSGPPKNDEERALLQQASEISTRRNAEIIARRATGNVSVAEAPAKAFAGPGTGNRGSASAGVKKTAAPAVSGPKALTEMPEGDAAIQEAARNLKGPPKNDIERRVLAEAAQISERQQEATIARRSSGRSTVEESPAQGFAAPKKSAAPETVKDADGGDVKVGDTVVIGTTNRGQYGRTEWKITKTYPNGTVDLQSTYETSTHKARTRNGVDPSTLRRAGATAAKKATPAATGEITDKSTVADLKKIAADRGIDVKGLRLKKDIRDRIEGKSAPTLKSKAPASGDDLDKMTKAELLEHARQGKMLRTINQSMTKDRIKAEIRKYEEIGPAQPGSQDDKDARIQELLGKKPTVADLKKYAQDNNIPVTKSRPLKADLVDAILSHEPGKAPAVPAKKVTPPATPTVSGPPVRTLRQVTDASGRITKVNRPRADEPIYLPNGGSDQGLVHLDSEVGSLWGDLYADDREPNSFLNEIAHIGEDLGEAKIDLNEVLKRLRALKERASDKAVADRIEKAIEGIDAPPVKVPDIPGIPAPVKKFLEELAKIPTARKTGRIGASNPRESVLDKKIKAIRDFSEGKMRARELERRLEERDLHESADGAFAMWKLGERLVARTFEHYEKDANGRTIVVSEPNPDWPAVQQWLRDIQAKGQN